MKLLTIELGQRLLARHGRAAWKTAKRKRRRRHWWARDAHVRARAQHGALIATLGAKCAECGSEHRLEIDHVDGRTWRSNSLAFRDRVKRYWREFKEGIRLRVLCRACNGSLGARIKRRYSQPAH